MDVSQLRIAKDTKEKIKASAFLLFESDHLSVEGLRRLGSFETKSLDLRNIFCRSYLVNTR